MKVIFLDIDGVLNSRDNLNALTCHRRSNARINDVTYKSNSTIKTRDCFGQLFDERCCHWLGYIIEMTGAKIVISSTWRYSGLDFIRDLWQSRNLPGEIIGITPSAISHQDTYNCTCRGDEIKSYIDENKMIEKFCIIDDDNDMLNDQTQFFVRTDNQFGLCREKALEAIKILNE